MHYNLERLLERSESRSFYKLRFRRILCKMIPDKTTFRSVYTRVHLKNNISRAEDKQYSKETRKRKE